MIKVLVETRERGRPCPEFLRKYGLDRLSHPANWFNSVLPLTPKDNFEEIGDVDLTGDGRTKFSVSNWTIYTNVKGHMANAREYGHTFAGRWSEFDNDECRRFLELIILDGLNTSPKMTSKLKSQDQDKM